MIFSVVLILAAWQDLRRRSLGTVFLAVSGMAGLATCICSGRPWQDALCSVMAGVLLLFLSHMTNSAIGEGDGWFFVVSGLYLGLLKNIALFLSGLLFCGIFSLTLIATLAGRKSLTRNLRIPFIPFLLPMGLWLALA